MTSTDFVRKVSVQQSDTVDTLQRATQLAIAPMHPFAKGKLTEDGVQWSAEITTTTDDWTEVESETIDLSVIAKIIEVELALTIALRSTGPLNYAKFKWQGRNQGGTWEDLCNEITYAADAHTYKEYTVSGRFKTTVNFNALPFEVRAVVKREDSAENVIAKVKNSSYVAVLV